MKPRSPSEPRSPFQVDGALAMLALAAMALIPVLEMGLRPVQGSGIENAPVLVQHLGLVLAMCGALAAQRTGHLSGIGNALAVWVPQRWHRWLEVFAGMGAAVVCGALAFASARLVHSEMDSPRALAYGIPAWYVQSLMPLCFAWLGMRLVPSLRSPVGWVGLRWALPLLGAVLAFWVDGASIGLGTGLVLMLALLLSGAPVFVVLGGLALWLFASEAMPLASVALSHYQITVNPSLPALPLFTLAGLVFANTQASQRLSVVFLSLMGGGVRGTAIAVTVLCSFFTAFTGGSGVTILALGGLVLPLLLRAGYPSKKGMGLVTSASALGVLLAPSVPLIMYAIIAKVPITTMFVAGVVPAVVMVVVLLWVGGFLRLPQSSPLPTAQQTQERQQPALGQAVWRAKWELAAPLLAVGSLASGLATPTESAALTAVYAVITQGLAHRELDWRKLKACLMQTAEVIGAVMLILGMALALTNYLIDAGIPDQATDWVQSLTSNKYVFLLALNIFLFVAGALMEIFAAIVVLVPLLLPLAMSYGIDPVHFGIVFLANLEMGFLCPPAGMNIYFASAVFNRPLPEVVRSVGPALLAMFVATLLLSWLPLLSTGLPSLLGAMP